MSHHFLPGLWENIFVNAPIGIFSTDLNRVITSANQLAAQLHGLKDGNELIGKCFPDFVCRFPPLLNQLGKVLDHSIEKADINYQLNESSEIKVLRLVSTLLRDKNYTPIGLLNMCEDITLEKKLAEQVKSYTHNLEGMVRENLKELKSANLQLIQSEKLRILGNLVVSIAHEMGNPLCSLEYLMTDIRESTTDKGIAESIELCLAEIGRMERLLSRLRELYRSTDGKKSSASVNNLLMDVLQINRAHLLSKNIRVEEHLVPGLPLIFVSKDQIKQVFMNIIINAVDSMPDGGQLKVATRLKDKDILVELSDTGVGIPGENLDKIFTPFFTTKLNASGLGLGLSVSNQIVEAHQGKLWVKSKNREGSSFFISLPCKLGNDKPADRIHTQKSAL